jgi:hypothetical protein
MPLFHAIFAISFSIFDIFAMPFLSIISPPPCRFHADTPPPFRHYFLHAADASRRYAMIFADFLCRRYLLRFRP